jgi:hypothetical protein
MTESELSSHSQLIAIIGRLECMIETAIRELLLKDSDAFVVNFLQEQLRTRDEEFQVAIGYKRKEQAR